MKEANLTTHRGLPLLVQQGRLEEFPEPFRHYIRSCWIRKLKAFTLKEAPRLRERIDGIFANKRTTVAVALFPDDQVKRGEERIVGWAVRTGDVLQYVYVRKLYRHGGAGQLLLAISMPKDAEYVQSQHWARELPKDGTLLAEGLPLIFYVGNDIIRQ